MENIINWINCFRQLIIQGTLNFNFPIVLMYNLKKRPKNKLFASIKHNTVPSRCLLGTMPSLYGDSYWYCGPNLWEPPVILALRDLVKPGSVVFDVGGNMGGITSAMSRLVGPKGVVCTFEASPRIIGKLQDNMVVQGHNNVSVYHRAIFSKSNEIITIYEGDHLNDSIYIENSPTKAGASVKTLALNDFSDSYGLVPDLIKIDIEGAEYEALVGASRMIEIHHPHLLLEQQSSDTRCLYFLIDRDYIIIDLNNYRQIRTEADYPVNSKLRNVLCIHQDRVIETAYKLPLAMIDICKLDSTDFNKNHMNGITSNTFELEAGRYLLDVNFVAEGFDNNMMCGVRADGIDIFRYHGYSKMLAADYFEWVIDLSHKSNIHLYFDFHDGSADPTFTFNEVSIKKVKGLVSSLRASFV